MSYTPYVSAAAEGTAQLFSGKGNLRSLAALSVAAAKRWVYVYDGTDATGTLIAGPFPVEAGQPLSITFFDGDQAPPTKDELEHKLGHFSTGVFVGSSTSGTTYTASGAADFRFNAEAY